MATTYSTSLKLALMANGENSGTWGTVTNTNWNMIEQSVAGSVTITMSNANYTLSNPNGAVGEAHAAVLNVGGTNSGVYQVVAPLAQKIYMVSNQTSGGYAITVGASTGLVATIPNGATTLVYCDGTGFYSGVSGASGNFNIGGNLTAGGTLTVGGNAFTSNITSTGIVSANELTAPTSSVTTAAVGNETITVSLGVGTAASGTSGEIRATTNITAYYSSDKRLKENIAPIIDPLAKVAMLNGCSFDWVKDYIDARGGEDGFFVRKHDVGLIAQQVQEVIPEAVAERPDGYLGVQYDKVIPLLVECIKELSAKVEALENRHGA